MSSLTEIDYLVILAAISARRLTSRKYSYIVGLRMMVLNFGLDVDKSNEILSQC